jgi:outer membrane protein assembly factor BamE (lipoprotein component of BamABCDE complex)
MKKIILILLVMVFLAGCATHHGPLFDPSNNPEKRFYIEGPKITPQQVEAVIVSARERLIKIGMTKDEVKELLGEPQTRGKGHIINHPEWENWEWKYIHKKRFRVTFVNDKVVRYGWWDTLGSLSIRTFNP